MDVGTLSDNIAAVVQSGARVSAKDNVEVNAVGIQSLTGYVISGAGGAVAAGASVMDWSIGQTLQTNYSDNSGQSANGLVNGNGNPDSNAASQSQSGTGLVTGGSGLGSLTTGGAQANSNAGEINSATGTGRRDGERRRRRLRPRSWRCRRSIAGGAWHRRRSSRPGAKITAGQNIGVEANEDGDRQGSAGARWPAAWSAWARRSISCRWPTTCRRPDDGTNTAGKNISVQCGAEFQCEYHRA